MSGLDFDSLYPNLIGRDYTFILDEITEAKIDEMLAMAQYVYNLNKEDEDVENIENIKDTRDIPEIKKDQ